MSSVPIWRDGSVYKRKLNAVRPRAGGDRYFDRVIMLAPFSGSGQTFVDYSLLNNAFTFNQVGAIVIQQDASKQLFDVNTLHVLRTTAQANKNLRVTNLTNPILSTDDICIEFWCWQNTCSKFSTAPRWFELNQQNTPGVFATSFQLLACNGSAPASVELSNSSGIPATQPFTLGQWNYHAVQYVASAGTAYYSRNGAAVSNFPMAYLTRNGWRMQMMLSSNGIGAYFYELWFAQLRVTLANRYGSDPAPVPIAPWPTYGR